jgi:hypothetical protein
MKNEMDESGSLYRAAGAFRPGVLRRGTNGIARDYAFGRSLDTSVPSQWYRVMLPLAVYEQSTSPDLHDVRVFNQSGEPVPFSLVSATRPQAQRNPRRCASSAGRLAACGCADPVTAIRSCSVPETALRLCWRGKKPPQPGNIIC